MRRVYDVPETPFAGLLAALDAIGRDEVFVTPTARARDLAVWGELLSTCCGARGAAGALTDGLVRDCGAIEALGFPVAAAGTIPYDSKGRHEIVGHRVACSIDGVRIEPGDLVFADLDGCVITPRAHIARVVGAALEKQADEHLFRDAVAAGMPAVVAYDKFGVL
ncbi:RraA family protein [Dactylosporangium sp. CA-233914]|uniref:RraA family protein n=1 Tax=Dactylosporangium sp. CA-233914 TaxID=3239934 RepID=UPI003D8D3021